MEFKEITKKDAEASLAHELEKLRRTGVGLGGGTGEQADIMDRDFDGFKRLFAKYLSAEAKAGIDWAKIETLPGDSVGAIKVLLIQFVDRGPHLFVTNNKT